MPSLLSILQQLWPWVLGALAGFLLLSGLDDLVPLAICASQRVRRKRRTPLPLPKDIIERRIAIFVPCWKESAVIGNMVRHNLATVRYSNFDFFLGVYPNDPETQQAVRQLSETYRNVHMAVCPNPGPTSKADCLNAIYARMGEFEQRQGVHFNTVVLHDAEDLIHPDALQIINRERLRYAMVQVPVLPLPTSPLEFTHGLYCDEFSEFQIIDMPAREYCGSFVPSNGVGTGFARHILQRLAHERSAVFNPASLTEDYEIGVYIHSIGHKQRFVPLARGERGYAATREYFPRKVKSAIRQRTRWVTGIALQSWERDGWRGSWMTKYWFWRDRKGLLANPVSLLTNFLYVFGTIDWAVSTSLHRPWAFAVHSPILLRLCAATSTLQILRTALRMACVGRIFGAGLALTLPMRLFFGNYVNSCASIGALRRFVHSKLRGEPLVWLKTEHAYPNASQLPLHRREVKEVLLSSGLVEERQLAPLITQTGEDLLRLLQQTGVLDENGCCQALSLQSGLAVAQIDYNSLKRRVLEFLPLHISDKLRVVPFAVREGRVLLASDRVPDGSLFEQLRPFSRLPVEVQLVTTESLERLRALQRCDP